jgi:tetratricopeptide (TPR) repeat protein
MKPRLFLSYGRGDDEAFVRRLYDRLKREGYPVWYDRVDLPSRGEDFPAELQTAIRQAERVLLVCGPHAKKSPWVAKEWQTAQEACLPILPLLRLGDYAESIPAAIGPKDARDFRPEDRFEAEFAALLTQLGHEPLPLATPHHVPALPSAYVRRAADLQALIAALRVEATGPIVLTSKQQTTAMYGVGGIGKTTLASALCYDCDIRRTFREGVFWVDIGPMGRVEDGLKSILGTFIPDLKENELKPLQQLLDAVLANKQVLIVLDDVWEAAHAEAFRLANPRCRLLVTTRLKTIAVHLGAVKHELEHLTEAEGLALFREKAGRGPDDPAPYLAEEKAIIALLEGHALALSLAADWLLLSEGVDTPADLLARLQAGQVFAELELESGNKNRHLELSLRLSYDRLSAERQAQFRALGVFVGDYDLAALMALWEISDEQAAKDALKDLLNAGLLRLVEGAAGRYGQHGLLRTYARALAAQAGELPARLARHFAHYGARHGDANANGDENRHGGIKADFANLRAALDWGLREQPAAAAYLVYALDYYMTLRESKETRGDLLRAGLAAAQGANDVWGQANTLLVLGDLFLRQADYAGARAAYEQTLPLFLAVADRLGQANTLLVLGDLFLRQADYAGARAAYEQALPLFLAVESRLGQANTQKALGDLLRMQADYAGARAAYEQALPLYLAVESRLGQANTQKALGDLLRMQADYAGARAAYEQALPLYLAVESRLGQANTQKALGDLLRLQADYAGARAAYEQALPLYLAVADRLGQANTHQALGDLAQAQKDWAGAVKSYEMGLALYKAIGDTYSIAVTRRRMAISLANLGQIEEAIQGLLFAEKVYTQLGLTHYLSNIHESMRAVRDVVGETAFAAAWAAITGGAPLPAWL